jgi:aspartate kinase
MLGQHGFLAKVFAIFEQQRVSVDVVATSEVSVSLTLGHDDSDAVAQVVRSLSQADSGEVEPVAEVEVKHDRAILGLIADVKRSSDVMAAVFRILSLEGIQVEMLSQGASKVNISLVLRSEDLAPALKVLHAHFFASEVAPPGM